MKYLYIYIYKKNIYIYVCNYIYIYIYYLFRYLFIDLLIRSNSVQKDCFNSFDASIQFDKAERSGGSTCAARRIRVSPSQWRIELNCSMAFPGSLKSINQ